MVHNIQLTLSLTIGSCLTMRKKLLFTLSGKPKGGQPKIKNSALCILLYSSLVTISAIVISQENSSRIQV